METDEGVQQQQQQMAALSASVSRQHADFEARKKARLTAEGGRGGASGAQSDAGACVLVGWRWRRSRGGGASPHFPRRMRLPGRTHTCVSRSRRAVHTSHTHTHTHVTPTDNSRRAFYKEFRKVVEASDVVIQVRHSGVGVCE
jgi:hypothetical protein